jgi:hypothetical protein
MARHKEQERRGRGRRGRRFVEQHTRVRLSEEEEEEMQKGEVKYHELLKKLRAQLCDNDGDDDDEFGGSSNDSGTSSRVGSAESRAST